MEIGSSMAISPDDFAELHCKSNYSFLDGASHPEELVARAAELGYRGIAITDECSLAGVVKAHIEAKRLNVRLVIGAEFVLTEGIKLVMLAPDRTAYGQLSTLITRGRLHDKKGAYRLSIDDLSWGIRSCLVLWIPSSSLSISALIEQGRRLRALIPHLWIALELLQNGDDLDLAATALTLSMRLDLPVVASNDVHMHVAERKPLQDVLTAIRLKTSVEELGTALHANRERHLRPIDRLRALYPAEMLQESVAILDQCHFSLDELRYEYPEELVPAGMTPTEFLRQITFAGAAQRWPAGVPEHVVEMVDVELELIATLRYEYFFLTVYDIVQFARREGILCQGRGSAANSAVCYCLNVTEVDPSRQHVLFERFVSRERNEAPDIDIDFEHERREEVIQYIYTKYGRNRAALAATLITYRPRSAVRDVGKALGLSPDLVDLLAKSLAWWDEQEVLETRCARVGVDARSTTVQQFLLLVREIIRFPRHLSQHVGGFVISKGPLAQLVPIENASMEARTVIQWDKDDLEALGLLKVDVLGLGMLTAIRKAIGHLNEFHGTAFTVDSIPPEDPRTYEMLQRGDSVGVFQVESRAQMSMLPRLKPSTFYDLVIEVAIVRPGPIQGNMVHPYLRRRQGLEPVTYSNDAVRGVLQRTLGIPIFQEQVIELAMVAAGFSAGEADQLRRAMAAWKRRGGLGQFEAKLIDGMMARGHDREFAERVFAQIKGFGEYGFPESHAASFALLVYVSSWLKRHEPAAFYCGLLNSLPMGFYSPSQLIQDARRHGIEARPVNVQCSGWDHRLETAASPRPDSPYRYENEQGALRLGLRLVKGLGKEAGLRVERNQPYRDSKDLAMRAALNSAELGCLARAGALAELSGHRYQAHWDVAGIQPPTALWQVADRHDAYRTDVRLDAPTPGQDMLADYSYLTLTLGPHPLQLLRDREPIRDCRCSVQLNEHHHGQFIQVAGLVTCRQRPSSASGVVFLTLEDETGNINIIVWSSILERYRAEILQGQLLQIKGTIEREGEVIHVVAGHVVDYTYLLESIGDTGATTRFASRDFH
jgi:error-prone DNA polymerase